MSYNVNDSILLEHAGTVERHLQTDLPDFTNFDATLNPAKVALLNQRMAEAKEMDPDRVVRSNIAEKTVTVKELIEAAKEDCKRVFYFAAKQFKNKPVVFGEFGKKAFTTSQRSQPKLALYMLQLEKTVAKYRSQLIEAGAKESLLDNIGITANMLNTGNLDQEQLKKVRPLLTLQRRSKLNDIYAILKEFNTAAKIVYSKDDLRRARYKMPRTSKGGGSSKPSGAAE